MARSLSRLALASAFALTWGTAQAAPLTLDFFYTGPGSYSGSYGTMEVSVFDPTTLQVRFSASDPSGGSPGLSFEVTGFGFDFNPEKANATVANPSDAQFAFDRDDLDWVQLANLNAFPQPTNSSVDKDEFEFGVTEGDPNNLTPPGIAVGQTDVFFLGGFAGLGALTDVAALIDHAAIRIQSLPNDINGGSLFLVGTPVDVPAPPALALLASALIGLGCARRRR